MIRVTVLATVAGNKTVVCLNVKKGSHYLTVPFQNSSIQRGASLRGDNKAITKVKAMPTRNGTKT